MTTDISRHRAVELCGEVQGFPGLPTQHGSLASDPALADIPLATEVEMPISAASLRERSRRFLDWLIIGPAGPIVVSRPVVPASTTGYPIARPRSRVRR
jgi:hypothetical protein